MARATTDGEPSSRVSPVSRAHRRFAVIGLACAADATGLERRLRRVAGVEEAAVNPLTERAYVAYDPERVDPAALVAEIEGAGYRTG